MFPLFISMFPDARASVVADGVQCRNCTGPGLRYCLSSWFFSKFRLKLSFDIQTNVSEPLILWCWVPWIITDNKFKCILHFCDFQIVLSLSDQNLQFWTAYLLCLSFLCLDYVFLIITNIIKVTGNEDSFEDLCNWKHLTLLQGLVLNL